MRRAPLYSASKRPGRDAASDAVSDATAPTAVAPDPDRLPAAAAPVHAARQSAPAAGASSERTPTGQPPAVAVPPRAATRRRWRQPLAAVAVCALVGAGTAYTLHRIPRALTQDDIDRAVKHALQNQVLPSPSARAYEKIGPSVVRVVGYSNEKDDPKDKDAARDVGSGVVVVDRGVILTSLHVVAEAKRVKVVFADGLEADAEVIGAQPENDLAVLQAKKIPDDLTAATLRSTGDLKPGDHVTAVGFPFGIGPSVSAGVVSGLKRDFRAPDGERTLSNLIQFDAAANPGSSGGPLVTDEGEVVGIVTAILNPVQQRFFVGIGFAVPIEAAAAGAGMPPF